MEEVKPSSLAASVASEIIRLYNEISAAITKVEKTSFEKAVRIGELLAKQKASLDHGEWVPWIENNLPFGRAQAANYMRIHEHRDQFKCITHFTFEKARKILAPKKPIQRNGDKKPDKILDETGIEVPYDILDLWKATRMNACLLLNDIRNFRDELSEIKDGALSDMFAEVDLGGCVAKLRQLSGEVKERIDPYAVCPSCSGQSFENCETCKGKGFFSEFFWNTCVPEEQKEMRAKIVKEQN